MKTFIQVTEVWVPNREHDALEFHSGLYGPHQRFRAASERMAFGYDEGLPGKAWAARHPIHLKDLQNGWLKRGDLAKAAGLTCGIAMPVFAGDHLTAVLVMFCGQDLESVGAVEVWHNDESLRPELALDDGYYGDLDGFEFSSRHSHFPKGEGLPGIVWESGMPVVLPDLGHSRRFLRRDEALRAGLCTGIGLPSPYRPGHNYVTIFLSALGTPIARRFEIWVPDSRRARLMFLAGHCERDAALSASLDEARIEVGLGCLGKAWFSGIPAVTERLADDSSPNARAAAAHGLGSMLAIPVLDKGQCKAIVGLYL